MGGGIQMIQKIAKNIPMPKVDLKAKPYKFFKKILNG